MNNTAFNVLCNIAQTVAKEQNIVLEMVIDDNGIMARVIPIDYLMEDFGEDED